MTLSPLFRVAACGAAALLGFVTVALFGPRTAAARGEAAVPQTVRGWLTHWPDRAYLDRVVEAARAHHINHLELSHDIIMQVDQAADGSERAKLIEDVANKAKGYGIQPFIWAHEINTRDKNAPLDPETPEGKAFWEKRRDAYRRALKDCPSVAGVVLMFGSSPYEVWDRPYTPDTGDGWQRLSPAKRIRFITDLVVGVVHGEFGKTVFVRDFNHGPAQLDSLREALTDYPNITVISKSEPQDFQPFYPHSPTIGAFGKTPQIVEMDLCGEYWGRSLFPVSLAEYLPYRLRHCINQGTVGAVGRVDHFESPILGTPAEMNLYFYGRVLEAPDTTPETLLAEWVEHRYGLRRGTDTNRRLAALLANTWPMAKHLYFTLGFWTWKSLSSVPEKSLSIDSGLRGKSTAQWDPSQKPTEARLLRPDSATVRAILAEKAEAVAMADANLRDLASLKSALKPADFTELEERFRLAADTARLYTAIARAYWHVRLAEVAPSDPEANPQTVESSLTALGPVADHLTTRGKDWPFLEYQATHLRTLQTDLQTRYAHRTAP